jgi:hypothetical protein
MVIQYQVDACNLVCLVILPSMILIFVLNNALMVSLIMRLVCVTQIALPQHLQILSTTNA